MEVFKFSLNVFKIFTFGETMNAVYEFVTVFLISELMNGRAFLFFSCFVFVYLIIYSRRCRIEPSNLRRTPKNQG